jgi:hypothetical protein
VIITARHYYRKRIHTIDPFPERNLNKIKDAQNNLLEAIAEHKNNGCDLDDSLSFLLFTLFKFMKFTHNMIAVYNEHSSGMVSYVRVVSCKFLLLTSISDI